MRSVAALLASVALLAGPLAVAAVAQDNPFAPLPQSGPPPTQTVVAPTNAGSDDGLSTWQEVLIFGAGLVLIAGIGYAIVSDARNRAPVSDAEIGHPGMAGSKANRSQKQRDRARAKAKVGRAQRKRNRRR
jgi:hypothetical protein